MASLKADQQVSFSLSGEDEVHNPVPLDGTYVLSVDRPDILVLTDLGGFSGRVAATGLLGTAVVAVNGTLASGVTYLGSLAVDVVPGDVAAVTFNLGVPEEVTPDV